MQRSFPISICVLLLAIMLSPGDRANALDGPSEALLKAILADDLSEVQRLLQQGANPNARNEQGAPALAVAAGRRNAEIVKELLSKGADVQALTENLSENLNKVPVVWHAAARGSAETLRLLLQAGASPNAATGNGITPLMAAANLGNTDTIPVLIAAKVDLEARDLKDRTALMWAADGGQYEAARLLLDAGAAVDALGEQKAPPLMYAAQGGYDDVVALLVERGADLSRKATPGLTALDLARQHNQTLTTGLLEKGGRQLPPVPEFQVLRPQLYPENPLEALFLHVEMDDKEFETARQFAVKGDFRKARDILEAADEERQSRSHYQWALAYLQQELGDRTAALATIRKILATPGLGSRETLRLWKLVRDLGEAPPPELSNQVLGVVVESGYGPFVLAVAAYADGQPRFFLSSGAGVIGESWTEEETLKTLEIVRLAQELLDGMPPTEDRELPKPGRVRFTFLTPGGSYGTEESLAFLSRRQGRCVKVFAASDQLFGMLYRHAQEVEKGESPPSPLPGKEGRRMEG